MTTQGTGTTEPGATPTVAVLGAGVMGGTLVAGLRAGGWPPAAVVVADPDAAKAAATADEHGATAAADNRAAVTAADVVLLAVKPGAVPAVLADLAPAMRPGALVVSVAAGVPLAVYESALPAGTPVVRVMPNTPALVGKGASATAPGAAAGDEHLALVERMLAATGVVVRVAEKDMDAVTALSGSGPAYVFYVIDALAEAGVLLGLPRDLATTLAVATVEGAGAMVAQTGEHPAVLRERVSSPGGTTVAGVAALDAHAVRAGLVAGVRAAAERSRELGRPAGA
ncbi:pyrroline-5-carboxylate reductase [Cellulomonas sp. SLBN-39]|uniref:pyrroline-5-carboxylate reductase n=1 Tax=Cellulomonas sp. SLBN-39 TaxID=2768446 RepID=UPI0011515683|nr:pyrroline-5-carboxylate reductase [Cellulomonas sp. SLBN-39]TQL03262.1 pyrroline-5-carboxylate reductase [Cellulomonas sp. SLBN-39]